MSELVKVPVDLDLLREQAEVVGNMLGQGELPGPVRNALEGLWNMCHGIMDEVGAGIIQPVLIRDPGLFGLGFARLVQEHADWSQATFGPDHVRGPKGPLEHLKDEVVEVLDKPEDILEFADCLLLLMDALRRARHTPDQLLEAAWKKLQINKDQVWEKPTDPNAAVYHVDEVTDEEVCRLVSTAIEAFERIQRRYSRNGAHDTEPSTAFQQLIVDAFHGRTTLVDESGNNWSLYEGRGREAAVRTLNQAAQVVVTTIAEHLPASKALQDLLREYCWRVDFDY